MPDIWDQEHERRVQHHHTVDVNVTITNPTSSGGGTVDLSGVLARLDQITATLTSQGAIMAALDDAVQGFISDAVSDYAALNDKYLAALAAEAVDQAEIDRITAEQQATLDAQQASVDALNAADLDPTNPAPVDVPPVDVPPVEEPPATGI